VGLNQNRTGQSLWDWPGRQKDIAGVFEADASIN
jgi:hypothetical protein